MIRTIKTRTPRQFAPSRILSILLPLVLLSASAEHALTAEAAKSPNPRSKRILVLGDSLTEGYGIEKDQAFPARLEKELAAKGLNGIEVINAGISGSTSASGVSRLKWHLKAKPDLVIIALGANDGLRGLPTEQLKKNIEELVTISKKNGIKVLLAGMKMPPNYGADYRKRFDQVYTEVAKKEKVPLIPFLLEGVGGRPELNLADGIHPNEKGHAKIVRNVIQYVLPLL